jgi:hypothetical protein
LASLRWYVLLFASGLSDFELYWIFSHGKPQSGIKLGAISKFAVRPIVCNQNQRCKRL